MAARNTQIPRLRLQLPTLVPVTSADLADRADLPPPSPRMVTRLEAAANRSFGRRRGTASAPDSSLPPPTPIVTSPVDSNMAPKNRSTNTTTTSTATPTSNTSTASRASTRDGTSAAKGKVTVGNQSMYEITQGIWANYLDKTPQRTKLIDVFMAFLVVVGGVQFLYCVLAGNYPFNAFLAGFGITVGQFVLTAGLRMQTNPENQKEFSTVSPERAFLDYVLCSLILHFLCINFIN